MVLAAASFALPVAARADVMEVGGSGFRWVAGGPARQFSSEMASDAAPAEARGAAAVTQVADSAGPAQWRRVVAAIAAKYDISPSLLEAVVWQESRWRTNAVSPAGAHGLAQLMPATAQAMGVNADDPIANLEGGARYLRAQLDRFGGDLEKALAAYNAGPERVTRAGGVPEIAETRRYVAAIMQRLSEPVRK
jgi:soluble lytic murein transglycosylase-like protein